jgi:hypothetical protein
LRASQIKRGISDQRIRAKGAQVEDEGIEGGEEEGEDREEELMGEVEGEEDSAGQQSRFDGSSGIFGAKRTDHFIGRRRWWWRWCQWRSWQMRLVR